MPLGSRHPEVRPNLEAGPGVFPPNMTAPATDLDRIPAAELDPAAAFDDLFRTQYWPMVRSLTLTCGDGDAAADAVQEAFTRAYVRWRRIHTYDDPAAWVRHVALNRVRDHFRGAERRRTLAARLGSEGESVVPAPEPPGDDVRDVLARLPRQQRTAVSLFYLEQLTVREIALSMKLSEGAVKYHLHAGRAALRGWLESR